MDIKLLAGAAAIATGVGLSTLTSGAGLVHAAPSNPPPPCVTCPSSPGGPGIQVPGSRKIIPPMGGSAKSGQASVVVPHHATARPAGH